MYDSAANFDTHKFLSLLDDAVGEKALVTDADAMAPWLTDWRGRYHGRALAMVQPESVEGVAAVVRLCAEYHVPIVPQGGNSGMVGGATPDASGRAILLSLRRMNALSPVEPGSHLVRAGAGVILQNLHDHVAAAGRRFPLSLGGKGSATVGGLISTNAGGTQVLRHGTMRAQVAGVQAVLSDGTIFDALTPLKKDNRGYDLRHLLIGAEGTLGIVTAATLTTAPALTDRCVAWVGLDSAATAWRLLCHVESAAEQLEGFEILPEGCLQSVLRHIPGAVNPLPGRHGWHALLEFVSDRPGQVPPYRLAESLLTDAMELGLIADAVLSQSEAQAEAFWKIRETISEAERAEGPAAQHDISVPVADMADFIERQSVAIEAKWPGTRAAAFGHLGDGNVHFHVKAPPGVEGAAWAASDGKAISASLYAAVVAAGGSISAEHGIGQDKLATLQALTDAPRLAAMAAIKHALDPHGILNPGKLVPLA